MIHGGSLNTKESYIHSNEMEFLSPTAGTSPEQNHPVLLGKKKIFSIIRTEIQVFNSECILLLLFIPSTWE